jgi:hypothetical protein
MAKKKTPTWAGFQNSGFYNAAAIGALQGQLGNYNLDLAALTQQAQAALQPGYNQNVLTANQQLETLLSGYGNQLSGMEFAYDQQRRAANAQYDQSGNQALNQLGKRGMGRSSIVGTTLGALESARGQALNDIALKQTDAYNDIQNSMALARNQNAAQLRGYAENLAAQAAANALGIRDTNLQGQTSLMAQIAQLQQAGYQAYVNQINKQNKSSSSSSRSSSRSSNRSTTPTSQGNDKPPAYSPPSSNRNTAGTSASDAYNTSDNPRKRGY